MRFRFAADFAAQVVCRAVPVLLSTFLASGAALAQQPVKPKTPPASQQQSAKPSPTDRVKCIGVASAIGDAFYLRKIGITVFNNESDHVPIESRQIDNLVINKLSSFLSKNRAVRRISYPKGAFASLDADHPFSITKKSFVGLFAGSRRQRPAIITWWL